MSKGGGRPVIHADEGGIQGKTRVSWPRHARLRYDGYGEIEAPLTAMAVISTTCVGEAGDEPGGQAGGGHP
jgi:hypothetical protein